MVYGWFQDGGRVRSVKSIGSDQPSTRVPSPQRGSLAEQQGGNGESEQLVGRTWHRSSVRVRGRLPSNRITKQSQFFITYCFSVICEIGLAAYPVLRAVRR